MDGYTTPRGSWDFSAVYGELLSDLLGSPFSEVNARTRERILVIPGGTSFKLDLSDQYLPTCGLRLTRPKTAAIETAWYLQGRRDMEFLRRHNCKIWDPFVEKAHDVEYVDASYGYRWRKHFDRDQIGLAIQALKNNPTDRRVLVSAWDPREDGLGTRGQLNVPCPAAFTFSVLDDVLHSSLFIRSSDVFVGLPYDIMGHAMLMAAVGASIGCAAIGTMHVTLAHAHLYEPHFEMARTCCMQTPTVPDVPLLATTVEMIEREPDMFVGHYADLAKRATEWPTFNPKPELIP